MVRKNYTDEFRRRAVDHLPRRLSPARYEKTRDLRESGRRTRGELMYLVDTNVLIEAKNRYYAFDIAPRLLGVARSGPPKVTGVQHQGRPG